MEDTLRYGALVDGKCVRGIVNGLHGLPGAESRFVFLTHLQFSRADSPSRGESVSVPQWTVDPKS